MKSIIEMKMKKPSLLKDSDWKSIDGELCRVISFTPLATLKDGKVLAIDKTTPYASIVLECKKLPQQSIGFITHEIDFANLWKAFKERGISKNEELLIIWTTRMYKNKISSFISSFLPKLWVMICQKEAYELRTDQSYKPELTGEARWIASMPIIDWKPDVMA